MTSEPIHYEPLRVTDMSLAATLLLLGFDDFTVEKLNDDPNSGVGVWVFQDPEGKADGVVALYDSRKLTVDPQDFQVAVARVRKAMFSWRDGAGFRPGRHGSA